MQDKIVVITGANAGIGKQAALELAGMGAHIVMVCRNEERGLMAQAAIQKKHPQAQVDLQICDLSSQASIREAGLALRAHYPHVDVLLNNAGGMFGQRKLTEDGLEYTFALDHMGYFLFTHYLLDLLRQGEMKRIVNVSSEAHRFVKQIDWDNLQGEVSYGEFPSYGLAKLFNIFFTRKLAHMLEPEGITVNCLHPGFVDTNFGSGGSTLSRLLLPLFKLFAINPEKGAATSVHLCSSPAVQDITGKYFAKQRVATTSDLAQDEEAMEKAWQVSMEISQIEQYGQLARFEV